MHAVVVLLAALTLIPSRVRAAEISVPPGGSVQAAIDAALPGDVVLLPAVTFVENVDFRGKAITVRGVGSRSVLRGIGDGPVVTFAGGEGLGSVLEAVTVTGGVADRGGGIAVRGASPTIARTVVTDNAARFQGSGIYLEASAAVLTNNLVTYNRTAPGGGDAHSVELQNASPVLVNNTIAYGDSNGLIVRGPSTPVIMSNVFAYNGSGAGDARRGRGICDFSRGGAVIQYNLFHRNVRAAYLSGGGTDYVRIRGAELGEADPRLAFNVDGAPRFVNPRRGDFGLRRASRARDVGDPHPDADDADGSRNDAGFTGGPLAP